MSHVDDGALRRMIDEPFAVPGDVKRHYDACAHCKQRAQEIADDASVASRALAAGPATVDAAGAYARFATRRTSAAPAGLLDRIDAFVHIPSRRFAAPVGTAIAVAAVVAVLAFTPIGTLAQNFLAIFEPHTFVAINITKGELQYMPDLRSFGTMTQQGSAQHREVATPAQASALTHIPARLPAWLPPSVPRAVHVYAMSPVSAAFQFSAARARAYAMSVHKSIPPMPPGLDGSILTLHAGPMIVMTYGAQLPSAQMRHSAATQVRSGGSGDAESMRTRVENGQTYIAVEPLLRSAQLDYHIEGTHLDVAGKPYPHPLVELDGMPMAEAQEIAAFLAENSPPRQHIEHISQDDMSELPPLVIVEAVAPRLYSSGATAREIEDYLLQMPGVAPQLADEIRAIGDPSTTMPIPVPIDKSYSQDVTIDGTRGLAVGDNTGVGGMIVWQKAGIVYGVCGGLPQRDLMEVAQSLR